MSLDKRCPGCVELEAGAGEQHRKDALRHPPFRDEEAGPMAQFLITASALLLCCGCVGAAVWVFW